MLRAKALEGAGRLEEALAEYKLLADIFPGEEGRWRYADLLSRMSRAAEAREVMERMLRNAARMPEHYRETQAEWLKLARQGMEVK